MVEGNVGGGNVGGGNVGGGNVGGGNVGGGNVGGGNVGGGNVVDPHLLEQKLAAVSARLDRIGARLPDTRDRFIEDQDAQESVAFNLFIAFQEALDIAAHVIAASGFEMPGTAREHFYILQRHQLLSTGTAEAMARCAGLRNLIAHAYGTLDLGRLYDELPAGRATLERFCAEMARGT